MNSPFVRKQVEAWAEAMTKRPADDALRDFWKRAFTREPTTKNGKP